MSTVLQAAMQLPVVTILASGITIDFTADGLTIQGGKNIPETPGPPCQDGLGGGICAQVSSLGSLGVALSRVTLTRNLANSSGGGLAAVAYPNEMGSSLNLTVTDSVVTGNAAGFGGGIAIVADDKPAVSVTLDHVLFKRNRAAGVHGAITTPFGGGLSIGHGTGSVAQNVQVIVQNSDFESNRSSSVERLGGGAGGVGAVNTGCVMGSCPPHSGKLHLCPQSRGIRRWNRRQRRRHPRDCDSNEERRDRADRNRRGRGVDWQR